MDGLRSKLSELEQCIKPAAMIGLVATSLLTANSSLLMMTYPPTAVMPLKATQVSKSTMPNYPQLRDEYNVVFFPILHKAYTLPGYPQLCDLVTDNDVVGNPANPRTDWSYGDPGVQTAVFDFPDVDQYLRFSRILHGREVVVYIHRDLAALETIPSYGSLYTAPTPEQFATFIYNTDDYFWHIFGGSPFGRLVVKIPAEDVMHEGQIVARGEAMGYLFGTYGVPTQGGEYLWVSPAHEMLHCWNIVSIRRSAEQIARYGGRYWFAEGVADYYAVRAQYHSLPNWPYNQIEQAWEEYMDFLSVYPSDFALDNPPEDLPWGYRMIYMKGRLVAYLLDKEIRAHSGEVKSLDDVMRYLYQHYSPENPYTTQDVLTVVNMVTGSDFSSFFDSYVYGTERLPLDGDGFEIRP